MTLTVALVALATSAAAASPPAAGANRVVAFAGSADIERFAARTVADVTTPSARARALYDAVLALKRSGAIEGDRDNTPKARPPKTADELLRIAEAKGDYDRRAGCYEFSALYVAAARSVGLDAVGVERVDAVGTGQIGHIMAGVRFADDGPLTLFDLQNETRGSRQRTRALDDDEFAAHHYNHLAVAAFLNQRLDEAHTAIDIALELAPDSASFLNNRATVLAARGENSAAIAEVSYAIAMSPDVPLYRYQLGRLLLSSGELDAAAVSLRAALSLRPRYGLARRDLGWTLLLSGDPEAAEKELTRAVRDDPKTPEAHLYLALFWLARGDTAKASSHVDRGLRLDADSAALHAARHLAGGDGPFDAQAAARLREVLNSLPKTAAFDSQRRQR